MSLFSVVWSLQMVIKQMVASEGLPVYSVGLLKGAWTWYYSSVIFILFYFYWLHQIFCHGFMFSFCTAYSVNCLESFGICRPYVMYFIKLSNKHLRGYRNLVKISFTSKLSSPIHRQVEFTQEAKQQH